MSTHKSIDKICVAVLALTLVLTLLFMNGEALGITNIVDEDSETYSGSAYFASNAQDGSWDDSAATVITLDGGSASVSGSGAYAYDGGIVISNGGYYTVSGSLSDGSITVDAYDSSKVWIKLNGVDIYNSDDACFIVDQADKVFLTLAEGTSNSFESGSSYSDDALSDNTGGVIFSHDDLTINGSGSLTVSGGYKHGIDANDSLHITGGDISITCPQDGLHVNDEINIMAASVSIAAGDDGMHSDSSIYIESGTVLISECYEGLEALTITMAGGDVTIYPQDDGFNANGGSSIMGMGMNFGGAVPDASAAEGTDGSSDECFALVSGGTLTIINETGQDADGLDSNGDLYITGGTVYISLVGSGSNSALDYGSESGGVAEISGGTVIACGASGMAETFDSSSVQPSLLYNLTSVQEAGTAVSLSDADGNVLLSCEPPCSYSSVVLSCPEMAQGETHTFTYGGTSEEVTLTDMATAYGSSSMGMGGMGGGMMSGMEGMGGFGGSENGETADFSHERGETGSSSANGGNGSHRGGFGPQNASGGGMMTPPGFSSGSAMTPPDMANASGSAMTPPDMANASGDGMMTPPGMQDAESADTADSAATATASTSDYLIAEAWLWIGSSAALLLAAIFFAAKFKHY